MGKVFRQQLNPIEAIFASPLLRSYLAQACQRQGLDFYWNYNIPPEYRHQFRKTNWQFWWMPSFAVVKTYIVVKSPIKFSGFLYRKRQDILQKKTLCCFHWQCKGRNMHIDDRASPLKSFLCTSSYFIFFRSPMPLSQLLKPVIKIKKMPCYCTSDYIQCYGNY